MKHIGLFVNTTKPEAIQCTEQAARLLKSAGMECCAEPMVIKHFSPQTAQHVKPLALTDFEKFADVIVSFGGDGTILSAAKSFISSEIPIMGVNLGKLGFLAEFSVDELESAFSSLLKGEYIVEDRTVIESTLDGVTYYALNDFVLHKKDFARMITIKVYIDGHPIADYRSDGLILATPTGSTAYSLASGGPIIAPTCAVFTLTPVSPHSLNLRPLVIPETAEVWLEPGEESGLTNFVADGETIMSLEPGARVVLRRSEKVVKLLKGVQSTYYELLKNKLLWSVNPTQ